MSNMGNSFAYFRHFSVTGVNSFKMVGVACGLIPDRSGEPTSSVYCYLCLSYINHIHTPRPVERSVFGGSFVLIFQILYA